MYVVDFYVGRGRKAHYLGSGTQVGDLHPSDFQSYTEAEFTEQHFRRAVTAWTQTHDWPHKHSDSSGTTWTYVYDTGSVYVYRKGVEMMVIRCNTHRTVRQPNGGKVSGTHSREWRLVNAFPVMHQEGER